MPDSGQTATMAGLVSVDVCVTSTKPGYWSSSVMSGGVFEGRMVMVMMVGVFTEFPCSDNPAVPAPFRMIRGPSVGRIKNVSGDSPA